MKNRNEKYTKLEVFNTLDGLENSKWLAERIVNIPSSVRK